MKSTLVTNITKKRQNIEDGFKQVLDDCSQSHASFLLKYWYTSLLLKLSIAHTRQLKLCAWYNLSSGWKPATCVQNNTYIFLQTLFSN